MSVGVARAFHSLTVALIINCVLRYLSKLSCRRYVLGNWRSATTLGILMNTRGLIALIVLNIGLDAKILTPTVCLVASRVRIFHGLHLFVKPAADVTMLIEYKAKPS